ncbi:hypothetical protein [Furfurilactobacillus entadae]|uniref:hypothetical protein n=1 Tax=Furfurilactobacillus entadae TaxID=2922307 RepID=UPI0035ED8E28
MKINIADFLTALEEETYAATSGITTFDELTADPAMIMTGSLAFAQEQLQDGKLVQTRFDVTGYHDEPINIRLESSVINLPFAYAKEIDKMLDSDEEREVNLYLIFDSPAINVSKMRIDLISSVQAFLDDPETVAERVTDWVREQLNQLAQRAAAAEEADTDEPEAD